MEEKITLFCRTGKKAAKLFGLFADHKGFLPKMGEVGSEVSVSNSSMTSTYKLWHSSSKIVAEVIFYKKIKSIVAILNVPRARISTAISLKECNSYPRQLWDFPRHFLIVLHMHNDGNFLPSCKYLNY
jgi:hypothetical protein